VKSFPCRLVRLGFLAIRPSTPLTNLQPSEPSPQDAYSLWLLAMKQITHNMSERLERRGIRHRYSRLRPSTDK